MKKIILIVSILFAGLANAQTKFDGAMEKGLAQFKDAKTAEDLISTSAFFERVADAEKDKWLPYYYAALTNHLAGWRNPKSDKDAVAGKSKELLLKAEILDKNNADIFCLKQMIAVMQLTVDPMSRWQSYGAIAAEAIANAKKADPTNPRPYSVEGQYIVNVPEAFGGGKAAAKKLLEKSVALFETYKPAGPFYPNWGKEEATKALAACQ